MKASKQVIKMAADNGIDLETIKGTGSKGTIIKADIDAAIIARAQAAIDKAANGESPAVSKVEQPVEGFKAEAHQHNLDALTVSVEANRELEQARRKQSGVYEKLVAVAVECGDKYTYEVTTQYTIDCLINNVDGIAEKLGLKETAKAGKYRQPSNIKTAKSVLLTCFDSRIPLVDDNGVQRKWAALQSEVDEIRKANKLQTMSPEKKVAVAAAEAATNAASAATKIRPSSLELQKAIVEGFRLWQMCHQLTPSTIDWESDKVQAGIKAACEAMLTAPQTAKQTADPEAPEDKAADKAATAEAVAELSKAAA